MAAAKSVAASTAKATTTTTAPKAKSGNAGILKVQNVSPALAEFLSSSEASHSGAVPLKPPILALLKKIWEYVKSHNLQDPTNKREIYCDDKLKTIFNARKMLIFQELQNCCLTTSQRLPEVD